MFRFLGRTKSEADTTPHDVAARLQWGEELLILDAR